MKAWVHEGYLYLEPTAAEARYAEKLSKIPSMQVGRSTTPPIFRIIPTAAAKEQVRDALGGWLNVGLSAPEKRLLQPSLLPAAPPLGTRIPLEAIPSWQHQSDGSWRVICSEAVMLAMGMGTGKTKTLIEAVKYLGSRRVLVVVPKSKVDDWVEEFNRWADIEATALRGNTATKKSEHAKRVAAAAKLKPVVIVVNHDSVWRPGLGEWIQAQDWDLVAVDESQAIKSALSSTSKFMASLTVKAKRRVCMTGTPMAHRPTDIFGQYRFLDPAIFGTVHSQFITRYVVTAGEYGTGKILGTINDEELSKKFHSIAYEASRSLLTLPPTQHFQLHVSLDEAEIRAYDEMNNTLVSELQSGAITAANAGVKVMKLKQITSGFLIDSDTGQVKRIGTSKFDRIRGWLEEVGDEPVVVFARFTYQVQELVAIARDMGLTVSEMSGRINGLPEWRAGATQVLVAQHRSGSVGVDMTRACLCAYFDIEFSLNTYEQSLMRLDRPGQTRPVAYYHFVAPNTIDSDLYVGLQEKKDLIEFILDLARVRAGREAA